MVKIRNICNEVGVGTFYHSPTYSPTSHTLSYEPYIGELQLKLDESMSITLDTYKRLKSYLEDLRNHRIISFSDPVVEEVTTSVPEFNKVVKDKIEELKTFAKTLTDSVEEVLKLEDKVEELKETVEVEPTVEDVFKKTKRKK